MRLTRFIYRVTSGKNGAVKRKKGFRKNELKPFPEDEKHYPQFGALD